MELYAHNAPHHRVQFDADPAFEVVSNHNCYIVIRNGEEGVELFHPDDFLTPLESAISCEYDYTISINAELSSSITLVFQLTITHLVSR